MESSGPEGKVRGTAQQVYDKYLTLARDALSSGDRVAAEMYSQYADHYYRILQSGREEAAQQHGQGQGQGQGQGHDQGRDNSHNRPEGGGRDFEQRPQGANDQGYHHPNRNPRGVPVAEMRESQDASDDDTQPEGLDNASRVTY